jgi:hypothetical protein
VPVDAGLCRLVPVGADWCRSVPIGAGRCRLVPVGADWCRSVPIGTCADRPVPVPTDRYLCRPTGAAAAPRPQEQLYYSMLKLSIKLLGFIMDNKLRFEYQVRSIFKILTPSQGFYVKGLIFLQKQSNHCF